MALSKVFEVPVRAITRPPEVTICPSCSKVDNIVSNQISENLKGNDLINMKTGLENFK